MAKVVLLIGGNLGDRLKNINLATKYISDLIGGFVNKSSIYETEAWGMEDSQSFYNQVLIIETKLRAENILDKIFEIESKMGRIRSEDNRYISRTMDIDILFYDSLIIDEKDLNIPHKRLHERKFTLSPLMELMPDFVHPKMGMTIRELYQGCDDDLDVKIIK